MSAAPDCAYRVGFVGVPDTPPLAIYRQGGFLRVLSVRPPRTGGTGGGAHRHRGQTGNQPAEPPELCPQLHKIVIL